MKRALVLGASGGMGYAIVKELSSRNIHVVAFARNLERLHKMFGGDEFVEVRSGDVFQKKDVYEAAQHVDVIFHAINLPYHEWSEKLLHMNEQILNVAKETSAKLAIVENIYSYGRGNGEKIREGYPKAPHTKKGKIRLEVEQLVKNSEVPFLIAHFPDFYGPYAENTYMNYTLRQLVTKKRASFVGNQQIKREYIYTPDGAKAIVELSMREDAYFQSWNIPGYDLISGEEINDLVDEIVGTKKSFITVTKAMLWFIGLFQKQMKEALEMYYLNEDPVVLDGNKYETIIGELPKTSYRRGIEETLNSYQH
ncbi:SDR family NAD(P)-dependent oxidoreductase [Ornithinibacillus xuwenensis]|uniref:SDR family NAD(P)-dependent oxidoreductase n=1 Tax=Ornithinibacillus xuwenensis TaxID=3144668 RepID=A0ABU9XMQ1_9BACI